MIVIPDIHGRTFWKEAVKDRENELIIFLGDYLDPYTGLEDITKEDAYNNFIEILEFKKAHMDNVILLIGNHDCTYAIGTNICDCRADYARKKDISKLFDDNKDLFQLAYEVIIDGKKYIFSHAGIHQGYFQACFGKEEDINNAVKLFNDAYKEDNYGLLNTLGIVSGYRGGWSRYGSIVWADIREFLNNPETFAYQIVGHTQMRGPIVTDTIAALDCHRAFIFDNGNIYELDGTLVEKHVFKT